MIGSLWRQILSHVALVLFEQPSARVRPEEIGRARRNSQDLGRLLASQTREKSKFDQLCRASVDDRKLIQEIIQLKNIMLFSATQIELMKLNNLFQKFLLG